LVSFALDKKTTTPMEDFACKNLIGCHQSLI